MSPTAMAISPNNLSGSPHGFSEGFTDQEGYANLADMLAEPSPKNAARAL